MSGRKEVLAKLAERIAAVERPHPIRVAIDGVDAAGKTTLANELVEPLEALGRTVVRATIDGFHHPRAERYRRGRHSPEGYFRDSFDLAALERSLLLPLGPGGDRLYRTAVFDYRVDRAVDVDEELAPPNTVLLLDGVFLLRPELRGHFDYAVFVDVSLPTSLERGVQRALGQGEPEDETRVRWQIRYLQAQLLYLRECSPQSWADALVFNEEPQAARLQFGKPPAGRGGAPAG